jgi:AcrR family transcriptional regulator
MVMSQRRTGEQTKELLIDVGVTMLLQRGISAAVGHIRLQEVLRRAGLTSGAAYRLWPDQEAFQRDLAIAATRRRYDDPVAGTMERIGPLIADRQPLSTVVREGTAAHVESLERAGTSPFLIALTIRATAIADDDLRRASQLRHADSVRRFSVLYSSLIDDYGLTMRQGRSIDEFAGAMAALGEGFALQAIEGIPHPRMTGPDGAEWTLFGIGVWSLVHGFTHRRPAVAARSTMAGTQGST